MSLIKQIKRAFTGTGCFSWQWYWPTWYYLIPEYSASQDVVDYGMPEYANMYPTYQVNFLTFSCFQCTWYSDYQSRTAHG